MASCLRELARRAEHRFATSITLFEDSKFTLFEKTKLLKG